MGVQWESASAVCRPCDVVRSEVLHSIFVEFREPVKLY